MMWLGLLTIVGTLPFLSFGEFEASGLIFTSFILTTIQTFSYSKITDTSPETVDDQCILIDN